MERLLLLCLLPPLIFAQPHKSKKDPNDEPFLPIHPVYPYNPKLIKRGTERELISQLTSELYAPKVDAKDAYSSSYSNNYPREPYYSDYNPYPKNTSPLNVYPGYYNGDGYAYVNTPYAAYNSYPTPYTMNHAAYPYPSYYYRQPYYYPHYFNHAPYAQQPLSPSSVDHREASQDSTETENDKDNKRIEKAKEDETSQDSSANRFVDGGNYISGNSRDLDGQSSTYKIASPYNQVEQNEILMKRLPLPRTTYRVISVAGQPVGPDYPLPASYVKAQQMEMQTMTETLAKLLAQRQSSIDQSYENSRDIPNGANDGSYASQDVYNPNTSSYSIVPSTRTKTGVTYAINSDDTIAKANREGTNLRGSPSQSTSNKNTKYTSVYYSGKPTSHVTYVSSDGSDKNRAIGNRPADQTDEYDATQNYSDAYSQSGDKQEQKYERYQSQQDSYQNKDFTIAPQTPQVYTYQYSAYESDQQPQQDKVNSNDGNFGAKQYTKTR